MHEQVMLQGLGAGQCLSHSPPNSFSPVSEMCMYSYWTSAGGSVS